MAKVFQLAVPIYPVDLTVVIGSDTWVKSRITDEAYELYVRSQKNGALASTITFQGSVTIAMPSFDGSPKAHGLIAHELAHAVQEHMEFLGIGQCENTWEVSAYLIGYYTTWFYTEIDK